MVSLREITYEYLGSLEHVREIKRLFALPDSVNDILALVGPRRVGKSFLLIKKANMLLNRGEQVLYVSMDEPELRNIDVRDFAGLCRKEYPRGRIHLFLDEIQEWRDWDFNLRWLHDVKDFYIYVSGSSSTLQSSEIPSRLRGRYISKILYPLSYREIVEFEVRTFREKGLVLRLLEDYLKWGGFPEVWLYKSREKIVSILETAFYRDIVERQRIEDLELFREFFYFVLSNYSSLFTFNSLRKTLIGYGIRVDTKTVIKYIKGIENSFLIFLVYRFSYSQREKIMSPKKIYLVDLSFSNLFERTKDLGRRMENVVFVELLRRGNMVYYYVTRSGKEVDFLANKNGRVKIVEVVYDYDAEHERKMLEAMRELGLKECLIVTWDFEDIKDFGKRKIIFKPLWKWLLETD